MKSCRPNKWAAWRFRLIAGFPKIRGTSLGLEVASKLLVYSRLFFELGHTLSISTFGELALGRPLSILGALAQQLPPRLNEVNGNFDRSSDDTDCT